MDMAGGVQVVLCARTGLCHRGSSWMDGIFPRGMFVFRRMLEAFEEHEDVQNVWHNAE